MRLLRSIPPRPCGYSRLIPTRCFATVASTVSTASSTPPPKLKNANIKIVEVGPRDGLQNEKVSIPLETRISLVERLAATGLKTIEAGSFVSAKWVPQMADSGQLLEHILNHKIKSSHPITYSFLAPNAEGFAEASASLAKYPTAFAPESASDSDKATKPGIDVAVFAAATESFSQKNLNCTIAESLLKFKDVISSAKEAGLGVRAYISVALGCPFEGYDVNPHKVAEIATELLEMGADEISLGDTTGMGTAPRTQALLNCMESAGIMPDDLAMHFHDTYGQALVNTAVSLEHGIRTFDSSVAGLGGCPYSPGATGNVATENMVYFMETLGMKTGVDLDALVDVGQWISGELGRPNDSCVGKAVLSARMGTKRGASI